MSKSELLKLSAKVADHYLNKGHTDNSFKKLSKVDLIVDFPQLIDLKEIPEDNYERYIKTNAEESTLNYFKALVGFDLVYKMRTHNHRKN